MIGSGKREWIFSISPSFFFPSLLKQLLGQKEYEDNWLGRHRLKQVLYISLVDFVFGITVAMGLRLSSMFPQAGESALSFPIYVIGGFHDI